MMIRCLLVFLWVLGSASLAQAEDVDILQQIQKIELEQGYAKKEASLLKSALQEQIKTIHAAQENKITKIQQGVDKVQQDVNYTLRLWALWGMAIGAVITFFATLWWKTKDLPKIVEQEVAKYRDEMVQELRAELESKLAVDTQKTKDGLHSMIKRSVQRIDHEKYSKILLLTETEGDSPLEKLFISQGFQGEIECKTLLQVFHADKSFPSDMGYDLVILDSFNQESALRYVQAGKQASYLLYFEGYYSPKPDPNRSIIANSLPTVYEHAMTLLNFNRRKVVE